MVDMTVSAYHRCRSAAGYDAGTSRSIINKPYSDDNFARQCSVGLRVLMFKWFRHFRDELQAGRIVAEIGEIGGYFSGPLRIFIAESRGIRRLILVCGDGETEIYAGFEKHELEPLRNVLSNWSAAPDWRAVPERPLEFWSRLAEIVLVPFGGRRIANLGTIPCSLCLLRAAIRERSGRRYLWLSFSISMAGCSSRLDPEMANRLLAAIEQGAVHLEAHS